MKEIKIDIVAVLRTIGLLFNWVGYVVYVLTILGCITGIVLLIVQNPLGALTFIGGIIAFITLTALLITGWERLSSKDLVIRIRLGKKEPPIPSAKIHQL